MTLTDLPPWEKNRLLKVERLHSLDQRMAAPSSRKRRHWAAHGRSQAKVTAVQRWSSERLVEFASLSAAAFRRFGESVLGGVRTKGLRNDGLQVISPQRRAEVIEALRRGTVPKAGLDALAVGYGRLQGTLDQELDAVASGGRGAFKAIRGEYGSGKTFFGRWLQERARARGLATSEVQISETETPLHRLETVYRRLVERI
ncbi:MAG: BREX system ATP-binding domain-containing protein, partial [Azonexus sp.]